MTDSILRLRWRRYQVCAFCATFAAACGEQDTCLGYLEEMFDCLEHGRYAREEWS